MYSPLNYVESQTQYTGRPRVLCEELQMELNFV